MGAPPPPGAAGTGAGGGRPMRGGGVRREFVVTLREMGQHSLGGLRLGATAAATALTTGGAGGGAGGCGASGGAQLVSGGGGLEALRPLMQVLDIVLKQHNATFYRSVGQTVHFATSSTRRTPRQRFESPWSRLMKTRPAAASANEKEKMRQSYGFSG